MTEALDQDRADRRTKWARGLLKLPGDDPQADTRTHFLKLLEEEGFVPFEVQLEAFTVLANPESEHDPEQFQAAEQQRLQDRVDGFADRLFALSLDERTDEFDQLLQECQDSPIPLARLELLSPGLSITADHDPLGTGDVQTVADWVRKLFVLRPGPRARYRREALSQVRQDPDRWGLAARQLLRESPAIAELDQKFVKLVAGFKEAETQRTESIKRRGRGILRMLTEGTVEPVYIFVITLGVISGIAGAIFRQEEEPYRHPPPYRPAPSNQTFLSPQDLDRYDAALRRLYSKQDLEAINQAILEFKTTEERWPENLDDV